MLDARFSAKIVLLIVLLSSFAFVHLRSRREVSVSNSIYLEKFSEYERTQGAKLHDTRWVDRIQKLDYELVEPQLYKRFTADFKVLRVNIAGKAVLCVGARLGGEVRAFARLGALALGIDFNPGASNKFVLYGTATELQFASNTFEVLYSNILDHIDDLESFMKECKRVLKAGVGFLFLDVDQNKPDKWSVRDMRGQINTVIAMVQSIGLELLSDKVIVREKDKGKHALIFGPILSPSLARL